MSITVIQSPTDYAYYAKNTVPPFVIESDWRVIVIIKRWQGWDYENFEWIDAETFFEGTYVPDFDGRITIDFRDCYSPHVESVLPEAGDMLKSQTGFWTFFNAVVVDGLTGDVVGRSRWFVCNALLNSMIPFGNWSQQNFLTNQPIEKKTDCESPEWLTYFDLTESGNNVLKVRFYKKAGGYEEATVHTGSAPGCYSVNVSYQRVIQLANVLPGTLLGYYDLILFTNGGTEICRQRYVLDERTGLEKYFLFINALGGIDTLICDGVLQPETAHNIGRFDNRFRALDDTDDQRKWTQNTGMMPNKYRNWVYELLTAKQGAEKYDPAAMDYYEIVVDTSEIAMGDFGQLAEASFGYILNETVNVMLDTERAVDRSLHQSVADEAGELDDLSIEKAAAFEDDGQGGFTTEEIEAPAPKVYVTDPRTFATASELPIYYFLNGSQSASGSFTPGVDDNPFVIHKKDDATIRFATQNENVASLIINYYPSANV